MLQLKLARFIFCALLQHFRKTKQILEQLKILNGNLYTYFSVLFCPQGLYPMILTQSINLKSSNKRISVIKFQYAYIKSFRNVLVLLNQNIILNSILNCPFKMTLLR